MCLGDFPLTVSMPAQRNPAPAALVLYISCSSATASDALAYAGLGFPASKLPGGINEHSNVTADGPPV